MASRRQTILLTVGAALLSGALFYLGTGLTPAAWAIWLAPLPVLLVAPRVPERAAWWAGTGAFALGELEFASYQIGTIELPVWFVVIALGAAAMLFGALVRLARTLMISGRPTAAALALPIGWTTAEFVFSVVSPHGAFWSLAYTQADVGPVRQLAAVTGYWGITFLVLAVPSAVAVALAPPTPRRSRVRLGAGAAAVLLLVVGLGAVWLGRPPAGETSRMTVVTGDGDETATPLGTPQARALAAGYLNQVRQAIAGGARTVVLPEALFRGDAAQVAALGEPFSAAARVGGATVVLGVIRLGKPGEEDYNTAQVYEPDGSVQTYRKQHLLAAEEYAAGDSLLIADGGAAVLICKDLDFPALARANGRAGAQAFLVPAWDFTDDAWLHSRMAIVRGVENGVPMARSARGGVATVSDAHGRVLAQARPDAAGTGFVSASADVATGSGTTLYGRVGPWFPLLCVAGCVWLYVLRRRDAARAKLGVRTKDDH